MLRRFEVYSHRSQAYRSMIGVVHMASLNAMSGRRCRSRKIGNHVQPISRWTYQNVPGRNY